MNKKTLISIIIFVGVIIITLVFFIIQWSQEKEAIIIERLFTIPQEHGSPGRVEFSPDKARFAYKAEEAGKEFVILDGERLGLYEKVYDFSFAFSPDSKHFVFSALKDEKEFYVIDGIEQKKYNFVRSFLFSPCSKRFTYIAKEAGKEFIVLDGEEQKKYDRVMVLYDRFSPNGQRFAYWALDGEEFFPVIDGIEQKECSSLWGSVFSPNSQRFACINSNEEESFFILDGEKQKSYYQIHSAFPVFSPDSNDFVFVGWHDDQGGILVANGEEQKKNHSVLGDLTFSPDGKRFAYVATEGGELFIVLDEKKQELWSEKYDRLGNLTFSPDGQRFAYLVRDEIDFSHFIVLDGSIQKIDFMFKDFSGVDYVFSPDSKHLAYAAMQDHKGAQFIVLDGEKQLEYDFVNDPLFTFDSKKLIYNAKSGQDLLKITINIKKEYIMPELYSSDEAFIEVATQEYETADWKTYKNNECGFEMKYPVGWDYYLVDNDDVILPMEGDIIFAPREVIDDFRENPNSFYGKSLTFTFRHHIKSEYENYLRPIYRADDEYGKVSTESIIIDGIIGDGYVTELLIDLTDFLGFPKGTITITYVVPHGYRYLEFNLSDYQQINVFKKIIDSIKLTEPENPFTFEEREKIREHDMATIFYLIKFSDEDIGTVVDACKRRAYYWALYTARDGCPLSNDFVPIDPLTYNPYYIDYEYGYSRGLSIWADAEESAWYCDWDDWGLECSGNAYK